MKKGKVLVTKASLPPYEEYIEAIKPLWDSHWITNMGVYHKQLESKLKDYLEVSEVSLMVNGHLALEMIIQAFGFPEQSEIITTPFTFISTTHAIVRNRLKPVFCDIKACDGTIDETKIEGLITDKTVAILPVHVYGNICNVEAIQNIAAKYGLKVIYDAAHAFGEKYKGVGIGNFGDASVFSFHATKVFNTIEGGAVTFKDHRLYESLYNLKNFGIQGEEVVEAVGANAKMNEFCAIMGLCNLNHIDEVIEKRKKIYEYYVEKLDEIEGITIFDGGCDLMRNYAYMPIIINENYRMSRDDLYKKMKEKNIYPRKYFYPLVTDQKCYKSMQTKCDLSVSRELSSNILTLPIYESLEWNMVEKIVNCIKF